ncbi:WhiB family transcriptional regulator [Streptomyces sp. H27-D2]|uniref:WhiB family transcriptional regulator n=1 Tax=Streptomyces sp. H27-D2 TaxID=3046304 RepID=UPI002DBDF0E0|nr:WhiB family transcriptional regulator [Streptomyces sp. H27-D2]MEC4016411.1 WhiB family transcriptional regulator [Streptomyces sp. H27-D2]
MMQQRIIAHKSTFDTNFAPNRAEADWRMSAACADLPPRSVFTTLPSEAGSALRACNQCPVRKQCEAVVAPAKTWFDGVSGGRLWRNGREVAVSRPDDADGADGAYKAEESR